ncbi:hypothetical protein [Streptococcus sinensis]|uniref:hypothetical protein n=1 Tax=Streptococcus sinensis TaxID=176090 RepID=UPI00272D5A1D|nr:hypothetical protein [Streptococcus sinensis]
MDLGGIFIKLVLHSNKREIDSITKTFMPDSWDLSGIVESAWVITGYNLKFSKWSYLSALFYFFYE